MTRSRAPLLAALLVISAARPAVASDPPLRLWYGKPAAAWVEALPVGNGRLGAMVFGDPRTERLALNEDTLWSGGPTNWNNPDAKSWLPKVREAVFAGRYAEADALTKKMQGPYNQSYQPLGDLLLDFDVPGEVEAYRRELDLDRAVATTTFRAGGALHTREVFASFPDQVIVLRVSADRPGQASFTARLASRLRHATAAEGEDAIALRGRAPSHVDPSYLGETKEPVRYDEGPNAEGMRFTAIVKAVVRGGTSRTTPEGRLEVRGADEALVFVSAATSFNGFDKSPAREGVDPGRRSATAARPRRGEAVRGAPRRPRRRPRGPLPPCPPRPRRAARGPPHGRAAPRLPPRRGPRARGARLPVRPLPAHRRARARAASPPTCRASGTRTCGRRGAPTGR